MAKIGNEAKLILKLAKVQFDAKVSYMTIHAKQELAEPFCNGLDAGTEILRNIVQELEEKPR